MSRPCQENHVQIVFLDQTVEMNVDECQARARSPVPEQAVLDVFRPEGLLQQRVPLQIDHAKGKVFTSSPVAIRLAQIVGAKRSSLDRRSRFPVGAEGKSLGCGNCSGSCHMCSLRLRTRVGLNVYDRWSLPFRSIRQSWRRVNAWILI